MHFCELVTSQIASAIANASELVAELTEINRRLSAWQADPEQGIFPSNPISHSSYHC